MDIKHHPILLVGSLQNNFSIRPKTKGYLQAKMHYLDPIYCLNSLIIVVYMLSIS